MSTSATSLADSLALYEQSCAYALEGLTAVTTAAPDRPTSRTDRDVRTGVLHLADVADADADART